MRIATSMITVAALATMGVSVLGPSVAAAVPPPTVTSLSPNVGAVTGGQTVRVSGTGFTGVRRVLFQSVPGTAVHVLSPTQLTVRTPAHAEGAYNVRVETDHGISPTPGTDNDFVFTVPIDYAVSPSAGPSGGRNTVAIEGDDLASVTKVYFGSAVSTAVTHISDNRITVVAPARSPGLVDVRVSGSHGESHTTLPDRYRFVNQLPSITWTRAAGQVADKVSCATATFCVAIHDDTVSTYNGKTWSSPTSVGITPLQFVSCPSPKFCGVAGATEVSVTSASGGWTTPQTLDVGSNINDLSCGVVTTSNESEQVCDAIGDHDFGEITNFSAHSATVDPDATLTGLSCTDADHCLAVDDRGRSLVRTRYSGNPVTPVALPAFDATPATLAGVDCPALDYCVAASKDGDGPYAQRHGVWAALRPPGANVPFTDSSCATADFCVYLSAQGHANAVFQGARMGGTGLPAVDSTGSVSCPVTTMCAATVDGALYTGRVTAHPAG